LTRLLRRPELGALSGTVLVIAAFAIFAGDTGLFTSRGIINVLQVSAELGILAAAVALLMIGGEFDLSIGSIVALSGILMAATMKGGLGMPAGVAAGVVAGGLMGCLNGFGIARLGISPFIVTLGTAGIFRALSLIVTEARPIYGLPMDFRIIGTGSLGPLPISAAMALVVIAIAFFMITWTRFGTNLRAVGDNPEGSYRMGIPVPGVLVRVYTLSGAAASLASAVVTARLNTAEAIAGLGLELEAIAAVVMGGTSFFGGEASMGGTLLGALMIGTLCNGLTIINVPSYYQQLVIGVVFILAVLADRIRRQRDTR
jgi:ribose/xylose/arabinose/galactoside ABC-type transport system permease subunit